MDQHEFHFLTGLPRSGSTLLAAILRQNPAFHASFMSPVGSIVSVAQNDMGPQNEAFQQITDTQREKILRGIIENYYQDFPERVIFDQNRRWTTNIFLLGKLFPECKLIAMVRSPAEILASFERLHRQNALATSRLYGTQNQHIYQRLGHLMDNQGVMGFAINSFRTAFYSEERSRMLVIEYDELVQKPKTVMGAIHGFLKEPAFMYDFNRIEPIPGADVFDASLNTYGLHSVRKHVEPRIEADPFLPPDLVKTVPPPFWRQPLTK